MSETRGAASDEHVLIGTAPGPVLTVLRHGATLQRLEVAAGDGVRRNVVLSLASPADYAAASDYLGATVGRYANRIGGGRFDLDGREVTVGANDRGNHLHGGPDGFDRRTWEVVHLGPDHVELRLVSPDGDQGFPGRVEASVRYSVEGDAVRVTHRATTDAPTVVALTNHSYLNLAGEGSGTVDDHLLTVHAEAFTPVDETGIPLRAAEDVTGTPFDLRSPTRLGDVVRAEHPQVTLGPGLDHNLVLDGAGWRTVATLSCARTGLALDLATDQPGLQIYTGNFLDGRGRAAQGTLHRQGDGIALEPQPFPDSPSHQGEPGWPDVVLRPGEVYTSGLTWTFRTAPVAL